MSKTQTQTETTSKGPLNEMDRIAEVVHQAYLTLDDIAFRQDVSKDANEYLQFTCVTFRIKQYKRLYQVTVDAERQRLTIDELDADEELPF